MTITKDPALWGDVPQRHADQESPVNMERLIRMICNKVGVEYNCAAEIRLTPQKMSIRMQLLNDQGHKYVIGTSRDPQCSNGQDLSVPHVGELAEEIITWDIGT